MFPHLPRLAQPSCQQPEIQDFEVSAHLPRLAHSPKAKNIVWGPRAGSKCLTPNFDLRSPPFCPTSASALSYFLRCIRPTLFQNGKEIRKSNNHGCRKMQLQLPRLFNKSPIFFMMAQYSFLLGWWLAGWAGLVGLADLWLAGWLGWLFMDFHKFHGFRRSGVIMF